MPGVLVKQQSNGWVLLVMENDSAWSSFLKAGRCVGTATPIEDASVHDGTTTEQKGGILHRLRRSEKSTHHILLQKFQNLPIPREKKSAHLILSWEIRIAATLSA